MTGLSSSCATCQLATSTKFNTTLQYEVTFIITETFWEWRNGRTDNIAYAAFKPDGVAEFERLDSWFSNHDDLWVVIAYPTVRR
jgi:hypothetical protein